LAYADWMRVVTRGPGNHTKSPPKPEEIIGTLRSNQKRYSDFADWIIRAVHGKCTYADKAGSKNGVFSTIVSISQEAFALLLYKNGYDNWIWMHNNAATSDETDDEEKPGYRYTNTKGREGMIFTSRNGGWSDEGMQEFNILYGKVKINRDSDNGLFDIHYKEHWMTTKKRSKYKKQKPSRHQVQVASIMNDLEDPDTQVQVAAV
jgi:hypothetical protein